VPVHVFTFAAVQMASLTPEAEAPGGGALLAAGDDVAAANLLAAAVATEVSKSVQLKAHSSVLMISSLSFYYSFVISFFSFVILCLFTIGKKKKKVLVLARRCSAPLSEIFLFFLGEILSLLFLKDLPGADSWGGF
jgi:hypothetical protein